MLIAGRKVQNMPVVYISGGTGYIGSRLIRILLQKKISVIALVRDGSEKKLPSGVDAIVADPFSPESFASTIPKGSTFIQLLGVPHPGPKKKDLFRTIDLASAKASATAAIKAGAAQFIYISVAQTPTKIMKDYQECRAEAEAFIKSTGIPATFIRPWYVVGPGHYWPIFLLPLLKLLELIPSTAQKAKALRLVSIAQLLRTLIFAIEHPAIGLRILEIAAIRKMNLETELALVD
jgi:uncharacterized protein YbjT (DUF2867 family)